jgi:hypothetical protein
LSATLVDRPPTADRRAGWIAVALDGGCPLQQLTVTDKARLPPP